MQEKEIKKNPMWEEEHEAAKKGLLKILYNEKDTFLFSNDEAYTVADRLIKGWGQTRTLQFICTYHESIKSFKKLYEEYVDSYFNEITSRNFFMVPEKREQVIYDLYSQMEKEVRENKYNINKPLKKKNG